MNRKGYMVLYGTQTGTAEDLAVELQEDIRELGIECGCENVFDVDVAQLDSLEKVFVIISTWGDGDPPDDAEDFCEVLSKVNENRLKGLDYAVFALGDSGYELFCECGKQVDKYLSFAGAHALMDRVDCDIDIDEPFREWKEKLLSILRECVSVVEA
ncbi:flavodoxin domain-containing protein [Rubritalea spongiae]|uniref:Flavodoxin domain-containing protein n=1 Tax=Rubritalea spongiae TaxID=430797 RepID=A0ABW5E753_9BACT